MAKRRTSYTKNRIRRNLVDRLEHDLTINIKTLGWPLRENLYNTHALLFNLCFDIEMQIAEQITDETILTKR